MAVSEAPNPVRAARRFRSLSSLVRRAVHARRIRAALTVIGVATSTLLVMVLLAAFRNPVVSVSGYLAQPGFDVWVMPAGTDNLVRTAGFLPVSLLDGIREIEGVQQADPLVRVFVHATSRPGFGRPGRSLMLFALAYRTPDGLGGPSEFHRGRAPHGAGEIALDRAAAFRLSAGLGDTLLVNDQPCCVVGLTRKSNILISQFLFFDFQVAEHTSGLSGQASFVIARVHPGAGPDVVRRLRDEFPGTTVLSGREFLDNSLRESASGFVPVLTLIAVLGVLASSLLVALLVQGLVEDRRADIALLGALGVGVPRIGTAVIIHACLLVLTGTVIGAVLARVLGLVLDRTLPTAQLAFAPGDVVVTLVAFALAGIAGALVPVMRLGRIDPLEAFES